ncbi:MFS transporter [Nocardia sp. NPDC059180]|uniref:MFS transporter n=1 Tax=Nocardia sp. NPDC059180 TaxID=3346761 RepID=UPI00368CB5D7
MIQISEAGKLGRTTTQPQPPPQRRALLAVLLTGQFIAVLDASIVNVAIPSIRDSFAADGSALQLIVAGYVIAYAVLLVTGARLGDRFTQRRAFIAGLALFTAASLGCGLATDELMLIVFRFVQGAGAAVMVPQVMTVIQREFTGDARAKALGAYAAIVSGALVAGQVLGGLIVTADLGGTSWRGVFLVNVPLGIALLFVAPRALPVTIARVGRKLDIAGLCLLGAGVLLLVLPLIQGHDLPWPLWAWVAMSAGFATIALFVVVERGTGARGGEPLFAPAILRSPGFVRTALTLAVIMTAFGGWMFVLTIHLQQSLGYSAVHSGLLFVPMGAVFAGVSLNWARMPARLHAAMIPVGLVVAAIATIVLGLSLGAGAEFGVVMSAVFAVMGLGYGLAFSPLMARALANVAPTMAADSSGIVATCVQLGTVAGVAGFGAVYLALAGTTDTAVSAMSATGVAIGSAALVAAAAAVKTVR